MATPHLVIALAAVTVVCSAAKLDNTYLPPANARTAGGTPDTLQTPFSREYSETFPVGSYTNEDQGVIVDALTPDTRISPASEVSGLGGPRASYGSLNSKVGEAAFKESLTALNDFPTLHRNIPLDDQDPEYQTSIPKDQAISTKFLKPQDESNSNIVSYENNVGIKEYNYGFTSDNGISVGENGVSHDGLHAQGGYTYKGNDGKTYKVTYTANKDGYKPEGDHLPTPHPIPEDIQKSIEQNVKDEAAGLVDDGSYDAQKYNAEGSYKESDNQFQDTQQPQLEKQPESDAPINDIIFVQNNFASPEIPSLPGFLTGSSPGSGFPSGIPNIFNNQAKPPNNFGQGLQGLGSLSSGSTSNGKPSSATAQPGNQSGGFPTQPGQLNPQIFQSAFSNGLGGLLSQQNKDGKIFPTIEPSKESQGVLQDIQSSNPTDYSASSSATVTGPQPVNLGLQNSQTFNDYQQTNNNKFSASRVQVPSYLAVQKNPQNSKSQGQIHQQSKLDIVKESESTSSQKFNHQFQAPGIQLPLGSPATTGLVSKFSDYLSDTPVKSEGFSNKPSYFVSSTPASNTQFLAESNTQSQQPVFSSQQATNQKPGSVESEGILSNIQNVFGAQLPFSSQQPQDFDNSYTYTQPIKPFNIQQEIPHVFTVPHSTNSQFSKEIQSSYVSQFPGSQKEQSTGQYSFSNKPIQGPLSPTYLGNNRPAGSTLTSGTQAIATSFSSKLPTPSYPQKSDKQIFTQESNNVNPFTGKLAQSGQIHNNVVTTNKTPFEIHQTVTQQPSLVQQYSGDLYEYSKPTQVQHVTSNKNIESNLQKEPANIQSSFKPPFVQPQRGATLQSQQYQNDFTQFVTATPQIEQNLLSRQENFQSSSTPASIQEQSKPETSSQFSSQQYKPFGTTALFGSQPLKPFTITTQFNNQPVKPFGSTNQFGSPTYKPFETISRFGSQPVKSSSTSTQLETQKNKPQSNTFEISIQSKKPFENTYQFGVEPVKATFGQQQQSTFSQTQTSAQSGTAPSTLFGSQSSKPISTFLSQSQHETQTTKQQSNRPVQNFSTGILNTNLFRQPSQSVYGSVHTTSSPVQNFEKHLSKQTAKPFTTQIGNKQNVYQFSTQSNPQFGQSQLSSSNTQQQTVSQNQFVAQSYRPFNAIPSKSNQGFNTQQSNQISQGTAQTVNPLVFQTQFESQPEKTGTILLNQQQETTKYQFGAQSMPQLGQTQLSTSNTQQHLGSQNQFVGQGYSPFSSIQSTSSQGSLLQSKFGTQSSTPQQSGNVFGAFNSQQSGQVSQGSTQNVVSQASQTQFGSQSAKPGTLTLTQQQDTTKYQFGAQSKPQLGQTQLSISNTQQHLGSQNQFVGQSYRPFSSVQSTSSQESPLLSKFGSLASKPPQSGNIFGSQNQFSGQSYRPFSNVISSSSPSLSGTQTAKPQLVLQHGGNVNTGSFNSIQSSQEAIHTTLSQASQNQFGSQSVKPVSIQSQKQETSRYLGQAQQPSLTAHQQISPNTAVGQSQTNFDASTQFNFGKQESTSQFEQNNFPNFGSSHATASASSQSFPGIKFGVQPLGIAYSSTYKPLTSQFGQNFSPPENSAIVSATSSSAPYNYSKPTPKPFALFSGQSSEKLSTAATPGFLSPQPQFSQFTTPSYDHKQASFQNNQDTTFGQSFTSNFDSYTMNPSNDQVTSLPQLLPSKPEGFKSACCKSPHIAQSTQDTLSYGSTVTPTPQTIISQTPKSFGINGRLKPEENANEGYKYEGAQHQQRFDEKTGYHY